MDNENILISAQGMCPICGSESVSYGAITLDGGDGVFYPATCDDCETTWRECYNLEFTGVEQVKENDE